LEKKKKKKKKKKSMGGQGGKKPLPRKIVISPKRKSTPSFRGKGFQLEFGGSLGRGYSTQRGGAVGKQKALMPKKRILRKGGKKGEKTYPYQSELHIK